MVADFAEIGKLIVTGPGEATVTTRQQRPDGNYFLKHNDNVATTVATTAATPTPHTTRHTHRISTTARNRGPRWARCASHTQPDAALWVRGRPRPASACPGSAHAPGQRTPLASARPWSARRGATTRPDPGESLSGAMSGRPPRPSSESGVCRHHLEGHAVRRAQ